MSCVATPAHATELTGLLVSEEDGPRKSEVELGALAEPLLDAGDAARLLAVRPSWVYEAVRDGRLPHLKIGRHIRFLRADLEEWILTQRQVRVR